MKINTYYNSVLRTMDKRDHSLDVVDFADSRNIQHKVDLVHTRIQDTVDSVHSQDFVDHSVV